MKEEQSCSLLKGVAQGKGSRKTDTTNENLSVVTEVRFFSAANR